MYRKYFKQKSKIIILISITIVVIGLLFTPVMLSKLNDSLGFIKYAGNWYNNDAIFQAITMAMVTNLITPEIIAVSHKRPWRIW